MVIVTNQSLWFIFGGKVSLLVITKSTYYKQRVSFDLVDHRNRGKFCCFEKFNSLVNLFLLRFLFMKRNLLTLLITIQS